MKGIFFVILVLLVVTLVIPLVITTSCRLVIPTRDKPSPETIESDMQLKVYHHQTEEIMELYLEDYIVNVVAAEVPAAFEMEALKAQAVAARTYAIWKANRNEESPQHPGAILCTDSTHCQAWASLEDLKERHGRSWIKKYLPKIKEAVEATRGLIMTYDMKPIEPLYHSTSGGKTENSEDVFSNRVPYLRSVDSPYEERSPVLVDHKEFTFDEFYALLKEGRPDLELKEKNLKGQMEILSHHEGGSVKEIKIGNEVFTGREVRQLLALRSAKFTFEIKGKVIKFTTRGYGHGVGMSQWGANGMAEKGSTYEEILAHYYFGIKLGKIKAY